MNEPRPSEIIYRCVSLLLLFISQSSHIPPAHLPKIRGGGVDNCVGVLIICVLVFIVFCIVCTVFLYCFIHLYLFLFAFSVLVQELLPSSGNSIAVSSSSSSSGSSSNQKRKYETVINVSYVCVKMLSSCRLRW